MEVVGPKRPDTHAGQRRRVDTARHGRYQYPSLKRRSVLSRLVRIAATIALALAAAPASAEGRPDGSQPVEAARRVVYGGRLVDAEGRPISGIYPLTFQLYAGAKARSAAWKESLHVAVDNGVYAVELGLTRPLPKRFDIDKAEIGVTLTGKTRALVREALAPRVTLPPPNRAGPVIVTLEVPTVGARPGKNGQSYADLAGMAYESERAKVAERVGGLGEAEIRELARTAAPSAPAAGGKARVGADKRTSERAGGAEGRPYNLSCPAGYVVTGITGGAGALVDSISLVCSPLE